MATLNTKIVIRNDSSTNWLANESVVLLKGEVGIEFLADGKVKMKVGDGTKSWAELPYFGGEEGKTFTVDSLNDITETELAVGDTAIVKTLIADDKYSYTGYVYNGTDWAAMDGNYNASNVYFDEDFTFTKAIGTVTIPASGSTVVDAEGKSLKEFFAGLFAAEQNPSTTQPSVSFNSVTSGAKEVGTKLSPTWDAKLNAGSYTYGPATGVTASSWAITDNASTPNTATTASGTFPEIQVTESTNYKITATASYADGVMPKTNIGNDYAAGQIKAGSKSATSSAITGYRAWFYGYKNGTNFVAISDVDSTVIRGLTSTNGSFPSQLSTTDMQQMFFAAPAGKVTSVEISDATNGAPQTVTKTTVNVEGANGYTAVAYDLFYVSNAVAGSGSAKFNIVKK